MFVMQVTGRSMWIYNSLHWTLQHRITKWKKGLQKYNSVQQRKKLNKLINKYAKQRKKGTHKNIKKLDGLSKSFEQVSVTSSKLSNSVTG